jgi:hypothetical protein
MSYSTCNSAAVVTVLLSIICIETSGADKSTADISLLNAGFGLSICNNTVCENFSFGCLQFSPKVGFTIPSDLKGYAGLHIGVGWGIVMSVDAGIGKEFPLSSRLSFEPYGMVRFGINAVKQSEFIVGGEMMTRLNIGLFANLKWFAETGLDGWYVSDESILEMPIRTGICFSL